MLTRTTVSRFKTGISEDGWIGSHFDGATWRLVRWLDCGSAHYGWWWACGRTATVDRADTDGSGDERSHERRDGGVDEIELSTCCCARLREPHASKSISDAGSDAYIHACATRHRTRSACIQSTHGVPRQPPRHISNREVGANIRATQPRDASRPMAWTAFRQTHAPPGWKCEPVG